VQGPGARYLKELRDVVSVRVVLLVGGCLALQMAFVLSFIGAFHSPSPHGIRLALVAPPQVSAELSDRLGGLPGQPLTVSVAADEEAARGRIMDRSADAALVGDARGDADVLLVASAAGPALSQAAQQVTERFEAAAHRRLSMVDIMPPAAKDARALSSFYLVVGWMVGGYVAAAALSVTFGARPANHRRTVIRLSALTVYAVLSGLGGAVIAGPVFGALSGHFAALWAIGSLVVLAAATTTVALQILFGTPGIGLAILLFVVLGNPSAGGPYAGQLLPPFWRAIGPALPTGAGTTAVRNTVYFDAHAVSGPLWVLLAYGLDGIMVSILASAWRRRRSSPAAGAQAARRRPVAVR